MQRPGDKVRISYRGACVGEESFADVRNPDNPLEIVLGGGSIFPPIEAALFEMAPGETRSVDVPAKYGFGTYDEDAVRSFPLIAMPRWQDIEEGTYIEVKSERAVLPATAFVRSIEHDVLVLDFNHPLAGKDLVYEVTLESMDARQS